ncbi:MAG: hypothetical protein KKB82_09345 [Candidatus Omnitrophica bacterium]|nr:hypothetical protein [Candidatus Omnitrophota bacterium]MBU1926108.1 hypothetical protein [Candidatus Omnitrophota bacterium]
MGAQICRIANLVNVGEPTQRKTGCFEYSGRVPAKRIREDVICGEVSPEEASLINLGGLSAAFFNLSKDENLKEDYKERDTGSLYFYYEYNI